MTILSSNFSPRCPSKVSSFSHLFASDRKIEGLVPTYHVQVEPTNCQAGLDVRLKDVLAMIQRPCDGANRPIQGLSRKDNVDSDK